jgi:hypothetical protein
MRARTANLYKRIAALEASLAQPSSGVSVIERVNLPDQEKQILRQALQTGFIVLSPEQATRLDAAIDALPVPDRGRVHQVMEQPTIVIISGADAKL